MTAVTQVDPELVLVDYLRGVLPSIPAASGFSVGTRVAAGVTPVNAVRVRLIGGAHHQRVAARPRLDVRVWGDGSAAGEGAVKALARTLLGRCEADLKCRVFTLPIPLPDPADPTRVVVMFSIELLLRGTQ